MLERPGQQRVAVDLRRPCSSHSCDQAMPPNGSCSRPRSPAPRRTTGHMRSTNAVVAPEQPVVPDADGEVGRHVGLAAGVLDRRRRRSASARSRRARWLRRHQSYAASAASSSPADEQRHRGLDVVPGVDVLRRPTTGCRRRAPARRRSRRRSAATCALVRTPATDGIASGGVVTASAGSCRLVQVEHQALADQRVERLLGEPGERAPARRLHDVPDQQLVVRLHRAGSCRCRRRPRT